MNKDKVRQIVNIIAVAALVVMNILANALPLNGKGTGDISDNIKPPVLFTPAGYVFAIWGLIYIGLIAFGVFQALPSQVSNPRLRKIGYWFALSCLANIGWLFCWHYEQFVLTEIVMVALLLMLIQIYLFLGTGVTDVPNLETWMARVPFSIYLGWISVATVANTAILLVKNGFTLLPFPEALYTLLVMIIALVIAILMATKRNDWVFVLVFVWAFIGIGIRVLNFEPPRPLVGYAAYIFALVLALVAVATILKKKA